MAGDAAPQPPDDAEACPVLPAPTKSVPAEKPLDDDGPAGGGDDLAGAKGVPPNAARSSRSSSLSAAVDAPTPREEEELSDVVGPAPGLDDGGAPQGSSTSSLALLEAPQGEKEGDRGPPDPDA